MDALPIQSPQANMLDPDQMTIRMLFWSEHASNTKQIALWVEAFRHLPVQLECTDSVDDVRLALSAGDYDLYLVDDHGCDVNTLDVLIYAKTTMNQAPIVVISDTEAPQFGKDVMLAGADEWVQSADLTSPMLEYMIRTLIDYRKLQETFQQTRERYSAALNGANDAIWDWDLVTNTLYVSSRWKRMLGYELDEIGDDPEEWFARVHADHKEALQRAIHDHLQGKTPFFSMEYLTQHKEGTYVWVHSRGMAMRHMAGTATRMAGSHTDVTEKKENEQQRETFVATLTHDLKTPIRAEYRVLTLMKSGVFGEMNEDLQAIIINLTQSNRFMYQMVDNLLTTYKYEDGKLILMPELVQLNALIDQQVANQLQTLAQEKDLALAVKLDPNVPKLWLDTVQTTRIVNNLAQNAITATAGGGTVSITTQFDKANQSVAIAIADTGRGIAADQLPQIFNRFNPGAKRMRQVGTGLGLYLSKQLVEAQGGSITVESTVGVGTTFNIQFTLELNRQLSHSSKITPEH